MKGFLSILIITLFLNKNAFSQSYSEILVPDKKIVKQAKFDTKKLLVSLSDSLELYRKEVRIRKFNLTVCQEIYDYLNGDVFASAEPFLSSNLCTGIYTFEHKTNRHGSHGLFTFYYDSQGRLIDYEQRWMMVIP